LEAGAEISERGGDGCRPHDPGTAPAKKHQGDLPGYCRRSPPPSRHGLRDVPLRASGARAGNLFGVDSLWQPRTYIRNIFALPEEHTVLDEATGLIWQRAGSACPVDREEADRLIAAWNGTRFGGITAWRLPTVNELLSLIPEPTLPESECRPTPFTGEREWFWSCDRRSRKTSWYVNTRLGYAGWQDNGCRYFVRAVALSPA